MRSFSINNENEKYIGKNIYKVIGTVYPKLSVGNLNKVFRQKDVKVNKVRISKDYILSKNDFVEVYLTDDLLFGKKLDLNYIYEDENILAVYKDEGFLSCNESHIYSENENNIYIEDLVRKEKGNNINICHRLDTNTKGIVLFAKNDIAYEELLYAFKHRLITKKYLAFVYSKPPKDKDILTAYLKKDTKNSLVYIYDTNVKGSIKIVTEYFLLKYFKDENVSMLDITLHTGKTHQIRAHLRHIGTPIIGDPKYCTNEINKKYNLKSQALFAYKYNFNFDKNNKLYYLNDVCISLNTSDIVSQIIRNKQ